jgi:hypothetical protein
MNWAELHQRKSDALVPEQIPEHDLIHNRNKPKSKQSRRTETQDAKDDAHDVQRPNLFPTVAFDASYHLRITRQSHPTLDRGVHAASPRNEN